MAVSARAEKFPFPQRIINFPNLNSKRNSPGNFSDVQSDIVINVDGVNFSLHKFPLSSRSGRIRKLAGELSDSDSLANPMMEFSNFPGGPDTFELAAKFCYGINFEIMVTNIASLRCAAEYLEMTDDNGGENLISRAESFIEEIVLESVEMSARVLHTCEPILLFAEDVKLVNRCIDAIASRLCKDQMALNLKRLEYNGSGRPHKQLKELSSPHKLGVSCKATVEWWAEDLSILRIDLYQRVIAALKSRGLKIESLAGSLVHFAQMALKSLNNKIDLDSNGGMLKPKLHGEAINGKPMEHEQRNVVESIVSMLPAERNLFPTSFLFGLLRTAIILDTTVACRLDLERRISAQLEHASPEDLLIPAMSHAAGSLFDVDVVQRILTTFLQQDESQDRYSFSEIYNTDDSRSPYRRGLMKVSKLIDMYLAEIAPDLNLKVSKFVSLAELLPEYSRVLDDSLYRAIDIFLKAHPSTSDLDRKKVCKLLDCQKLSQEACAHAARNERLPVQLVVQVLYFEQLRMRGVMAGATEDQRSQSSGDGGILYGHGFSRKVGCDPSTSPQVMGDSMNLRRDNRELKLEVARLCLLVNDLQKENASLKKEIVLRPARPVAVTSSTGSGRFFSLFSRKLGKMSLFSSPKPRGSKSSDIKSTPRIRRHSIS